ncbi:MAG: hypothetical protein HFJ58_02685 [Clostridia bacterium]|nr:hypothetical protein [Clostridia bacterium]
MKRSQKGITIVSLVITIIILLIIGGTTVYIGTSVIKQATLQTVNTNMMLIQAKTKTIAEQAKFNNNQDNYKGTVLSEVSGNKKIDELLEVGVIDDASKFYLLSKDDLVSMGLEKIDIEDGYIVNYETEEVIYVRGYENDGITYHKLTDMKNVVVK